MPFERDQSTNPRRQSCVYNSTSVVSCVFAFCTYELFVMGWAMVRRVCMGSVSSVVCIADGGGMWYFIVVWCL